MRTLTMLLTASGMLIRRTARADPDDRRDCGQEEGVAGKDRRDCKQEEVRDGVCGRHTYDDQCAAVV